MNGPIGSQIGPFAKPDTPKIPLELRMNLVDGFASPDVIDQPYEFYSELRRERPVFYSEAVCAFVVTRAADVTGLLKQVDIFRSVPLYSEDKGGNYNFAPEYNYLYDEAGVPRQIATLVISEGETHKRYRDMVSSMFSMSAVKRLGPAVSAVTNLLIDRFIDKGEADIYAEFCQQLPLFVMCDLLGWPREHVELLQKSADALNRLTIGSFESHESRVKLHMDQVEFHRLALAQLSRVRDKPDGSVLSHIVHTLPADGKPVDDAEFCAMASILNIGGNETTVNGLGSVLYMLASDPERQALLRERPELIPKFVEEALRVESPVPFVFRWVYEDAVLDGVEIPAGSTVMASLASANRDDSAFPQPCEFDLDRKGIRNHFSFGNGVHYCLGAMLARLELQTALERILDRLHELRIKDVTLRRANKITIRALLSLPVTFTRAA
jgi:cytochrome P450